MIELRKYGVLLTTAKALRFVVYAQDGLKYAVPTFAAGDVTISKDGGAYASTTNLPVVVGNSCYLVLTAAELTASSISILVSDLTGTQVWLDTEINVATHGHASAMYVMDLDVVMRGTDGANTTTPNTVVPDNAGITANGNAIAALNDFDPAVDTVATVTTLTNKTGFSLSTAGILAIWDQLTSAFTTASTIGKLLIDNINGTITSRMAETSINTTAGKVDGVTNLTNLPTIPANWLTATGIAASALNGKGDWNIGKTGYALTQAFPANFAAMVISAGGNVNTLVQGFLNTLIAETTAGRIAGNFDTFFENSDVATTKVLDNIGGTGGTSDWTASERNEIRGRLGITGTTAVGGNVPTLGLQTTLDSILADTNELQLDDIPTTLAQIIGYIDTEIGTIITNIATIDAVVDAIKVKSDQLTFTKAGEVDANTQSINNVTLTGDGNATPFNVV